MLALAVTAGAASAAQQDGGLEAPGKPRVSDVVCVDRCVAGRTATPGSPVQVKGSSLAYVQRVVFRGKDGPIKAKYTYRDSKQVRATVPVGAIDSRPYVVDYRGTRSNASPHELRVRPRSAIPTEVFPVRGPHQYWDGFGAGRGHDGMDVGARCGTPMVSALDGKVQTRSSHGSAGNYVVIDTAGQAVDLVYMHLTAPAIVRPGQRVSAGQRIGSVGETGNASGCHLHFEYWEGEYYGGGSPVDPEPFLRRLDRKS